MWQDVLVPAPPLKLPEAGSQAMSPAAAMVTVLPGAEGALTSRVAVAPGASATLVAVR